VAEPLLDFATADVDRIVIDDNTNTATLERNNDGWQLGEPAMLPAERSRIEGLLASLESLQTTWPVVSSDAGRERFEVSEDKFQRRLQLYDGDELLGEYFFGTSPGFRRTHARRADDAEVYALAFNNFDLPADANDWLAKDLLSVAMPIHIAGPDFGISKENDMWQLDAAGGADEAGEINASVADELVSAFSSLRVLRAETAMPEGERVSFSVAAADGEWRYEFTSANSKYYVKRSDRDHAFTISQTDYERITGKGLDELLVAPAAEDAEDTDENA
jgi:hypothetical protein